MKISNCAFLCEFDLWVAAERGKNTHPKSMVLFMCVYVKVDKKKPDF